MKVVITGDRHWSSHKEFMWVYDALSTLNQTRDTVVLGDAKGVDKFAYEACKQLGLISRVHQANWEQYGRAAGPIRNKTMLAELTPGSDEVWYFHHDLMNNSRGTRNCVEQAEGLGIRVRNGCLV